jgi:type IV secretory pathway ATPase VirB11/archaellum biosynthesis ATPase
MRGLERMLEQGKRSCPRFSHFWLNLVPPAGSRLIEEYPLSGASVRIYARRGDLDLFYLLMPQEYLLGRSELSLVASSTDRIMASPPPELVLEGDGLRRRVVSLALAEMRSEARRTGALPGLDANAQEERLRWLAEVVARYTAGLGLFELLLADRRLEDIYVDAPCKANPIHITMSGLVGRNSLARCTTNIIADEREIRAFVARMKFHSGRPFSEASPVLETDVPCLEARATVLGPPLSPEGIALALRRHSDQPWTLMRLVHAGMMDPHTAALISFLVDGRSTLLICGPRGAGKSSLLGAILFEFPPGQRILAIEDTAELPVRQMQSLGYKVQSLLIEKRPGEAEEEKAEEALRASLRMGESAIVLGEVRGREAQVLYDSMRTGKAGSSVLGTIHGESARSVYERVVHDMRIAPEAFQATDAVLTLGLVRPNGSQRPVRRLVEAAEVSSPPGTFRALVRLEADAPTVTDGSSELIGKVARSWGMSYEEALQNIRARAKMREALLAFASTHGPEYLSPYWTARANAFFWERTEKGERDYAAIAASFRELLSKGHVR